MAEVSNLPVSEIHALELGKRFRNEWIFRKVNSVFTINKTYAILGPNGSGKSTLLQVLWGQMQPSEGKVGYTLNGQSLALDSVYQQVSISAPYLELPDEFTLQELVSFHFRLRSPVQGVTTENFAAKINLQHARNRQLGQFSSGMRQRVKVGLALLTQSVWVFLDEPATNLDREGIEWYQQLLKEHSHERMIAIASNNPAEYPQDAIQINMQEYKWQKARKGKPGYQIPESRIQDRP